MFPCRSGRIKRYGYEAGAGGLGNLVIEFNGGARWRYLGVSRDELAEFLMAESKGSHLERVIKPRFQAEPVDPNE